MSSDSSNLIDQLWNDVRAGYLSRRDVLKRALGLGLSAPVIAALLAACGDDDDDDDDDDGGDADEPTEAEGAAGEPTEAEEEPTEAEGGEEEPTEAEGGEEEPTEAEGEEEEPTAPEEAAGERGGGGKITLLYWQAPTILNAHLSQGTKDTHATRVCMEPLFEYDVNTEPVLFLAAEWPSVENETLDPEGLFVIWKLREGVKWHDGEDFTADDVRFTYEWVVDETTTATSIASFNAIESVEVIDDFTIQFNFLEPNPAWFDPFQSGLVVMPEHIYADYTGEAGRDAPANLMPIGTGPFMVTEFNPGDVVIYELFPDYWDPGKPFFDEVEIKGGGDAVSAARAVTQTGEGDWAWNLQVEPEVLAQLAEGGEGEMVVYPGNSAERIYINFADPRIEVDGAFSEPTTQHPLFQHLEVRQALNLAMQRDVISEQLYGPGNEPTAHSVNVPAKFLSPNITWEYNLEQAAELLASVDFPAAFDNTTLLYQTSVNSVRQKTQEIVKQDLEQLGFTVELKSIDSGVYFSSDAGNPDTLAHFYADIQMYTNGPGSPYPISWAERFRTDQIASKANNWAGSNSMRYFNPEFDELHDRARTAVDEDEQIEIWHTMLELPFNDVVEIPLVWRGSQAAKSNRITYDEASLSNWAQVPVWDLKNWTLAE